MSLDIAQIREAIAEHGPVWRVVITSVAGSAPRGTGTSMLIWDSGQSGTIGGGALEYQAIARARAATVDRFDKIPLGPGLGQCCGGAVTLLTEHWDAARLESVTDTAYARPLPGTESTEMPLKLRGMQRAARNAAAPMRAEIVQGWFIEPLARTSRDIWIYGAGHVGRALVDILSPLPEIALTWVDTAPDRFPADAPARCIPAPNPADAVRLAPSHAEHLILTYGHDMDLEICHRLLGHRFAFAGLIGSATKWARFQSRLKALGHTPERINTITCPIGDPGLGKHPQAIAIGVTASLLKGASGQTHTHSTFGGDTDMPRDPRKAGGAT